MFPEYPEFKSLELEDLSQIRRLLAEAAPNICELSTSNLLIWKDFDHPLLTMIHKNLCAYISPPNEPPYFLQPIGNHKLPETVAVCLEYAGKMSRLNENFMSHLDPKKYRILCLRNQFDYIYETKTLAELKGRKFDGKRNHVKRFRDRFPDYEYVPLDGTFQAKALDLFEAWFDKKKDSRYFPKLAHISQRAAVERAFSYYDQLALLGGAILIQKQTKGFILGSRLNPEMASVHFQYGDPSLRGISQVLLWEACQKDFSPFKYINLEQDLGIPGLRKAKLSYYPLRLEKKFEITPFQKRKKEA